MNAHRTRALTNAPRRDGPVLYWMSREQRTADNWALLYAQSCAIELKVPLIVLFCLAPQFSEASFIHYDFMLQGLKSVETGLQKFNIPFVLRSGDAVRIVPRVVSEYGAGMIIADFSPLRAARSVKRTLASALHHVSMVEVDAHNIVPAWHASPKLEFAARTIRPKIHRLLPEFLEEFPPLVRHPFSPADPVSRTDWDGAYASLRVPGNGAMTVRCRPGEQYARRMLDEFIAERIGIYGSQRNDPTLDAQSHLSQYLHFGQISAQRAALEVERRVEPVQAGEFLEELVVRRELSDNFCLYNDKYDSFDGFPAWAQMSLNLHRADKRTHCYATEEFESAATHDPLWNAAQREMLTTGRMHGYMRMYWAKKILEWSASPEEAMATAIHLNDRYELDGRDPNGYAGIAWSIGGVHDRPWTERPVFGKIRYMNANGCARKFDVKEYCRRFNM